MTMGLIIADIKLGIELRFSRNFVTKRFHTVKLNSGLQKEKTYIMLPLPNNYVVLC